MPENSNLTPQYQDDALASFTDRLLRGEDLNFDAEAPSDDEELRELEAMVLRFSRTVPKRVPDPVMAQHIKANLAAEWQVTMKPAPAPAKPAGESWWDRVRELGSELTTNRDAGKYRSSRRRRTYSFALAGATVAALVLLALFLPVPGAGGATVGAVMAENPVYAIVAIVFGVALIAGVMWYAQRKR